MKKVILLAVICPLVFSCSQKTETENTADTINSTAPIEEVAPEKFGIDSSMGLPQGLLAGSRAPGFASRAIDGSSFDLYSELQSKAVVILFYRGKWCPVCNRHMTNFNDSIQYIVEKGARVLAITPETRDSANEFIEKTNTGFTVISDQSGAIMKAFDVAYNVSDEYVEKIKGSKGLSIAENNGNADGIAMLPVPATYVIGQDGYIKFAQFDLNYRKRATVKDILENL